MTGFRNFILRGNVVDLAIGVVIGAAFTSVVNAVVTGLLTPLIGLFGSGNFDSYTWSFGAKPNGDPAHVFAYGSVITAALNFLIVAGVLYFLVVRPVNHLMARFKTEPDVPATTRACPQCLSSIPVAATRCAFCTGEVAPVSAS